MRVKVYNAPSCTLWIGGNLEASLKQRLVGAAVLVALGVIFIPMLLERGDDDARLTVSMEIPPRPGVTFEDRLKNPPPLRQEPVQAIEEAIEPVKQARQVESAVSESAEKPAATVSQSPAKPATQQPVATSPKAATPSSQPAVKQVTKPAQTTAGEQWIVQVGSFSQEANAKGLRDKLKKSGFDAFVETAKTPAGSVYRVRIGPLTKREDAEKLATRVKAAGDYKPIVASYP